jgi:lauroyl/myristoyl acyltransferase
MMKDPVRSVTKQAFYGILPVLRAIWFPFKVLEYFVLHPVLGLLPLALAHRIFRFRSPWLLLLPSERARILQNLSTAFPDRLSPRERRRTGAAYARFLSCLRFDAWISSSCSVARLNQAVRLEGLCHLREAQERGRGVVLLGCHTGFFYRFVFSLARNGYELRVLTMKTEETGRIVWRGRAELMLYRKILERMEAEQNIRVIYAGRAYQQIKTSLEQKQILLTKMDNPGSTEGEKGVRARFLGLEASFSTEIFKMAKQHDAVCLPYIVQVENHLCKIRIYPPLPPGNREGRPDQEVSAQIEYFLSLFEEQILSRPEQWWLWRDLGAFGLPSPPPPAR